MIVTILEASSEGIQKWLGKDISLLKSRFDGDYFDFLLNDLLTKPDGFDGIVFAARSKLRRWRSCINQSAQIVLVDSYVHSAWTGIIVIGFLNSDGDTDFTNEGNDGQEFVATTSQGNYLSFRGGSGCLGLKFGQPIDGHDTGEEGESTTSCMGRIVLCRMWCLTLFSFREDHCKKNTPLWLGHSSCCPHGLTMSKNNAQIRETRCYVQILQYCSSK